MKIFLLKSVLLLSLSAFCVGSHMKRRNETTENSSNKVAASWFAGYHEDQFPPSKVPWEKYTDVFYAFAYDLCVL